MRALRGSFALPKGFAAIGAAVVVAAAAALAYVHLSTSAVWTTRAAESNAAFAAILTSLLPADLSQLARDPAAQASATFERALRAAMAEAGIVGVRVYDARSQAVYVSDPSLPGGADSDVRRALDGERTSRLVRQGSVTEGEGAGGERQVVVSHLPVVGAEGRPVGAIALVADASEHRRGLDAELVAQIAVFGAGLAALYGLLLAALAISSRMLARLHRESVKLAASVAQAEAASRTKSEFLADMSHELRTPLNAIIGFAEIMKEGLFGQISPPAYREYARDIHASGMHLLGVINDVLELARAEAGKTPLTLEEVDLESVLEEPLRMLRSRAEEAGLTLRAEFARGLAPLRTDARRLRQIVINLLANAVKFTPKGSIVLSVREIDRGNAVEIAVSDTGIGIAPSDIPLCLAPFGQVESSVSRKHEGSGLGLPLSAKLAERLGGRLELESEVGVGTTARVILPRQDRAPELQQAA